MYHLRTFFIFLCLFCTFSMKARAQDSIPQLTVEADTLREVVVRPDSGLAVTKAIEQSLGMQKGIGTPSLGDLLNKWAPGVQDYILHPFGFKQRRVERKRKKTNKLLRDYDRATDPNAELMEALRREGLESVISESEKRKGK